jgi:Recombination endonuclease VII
MNEAYLKRTYGITAVEYEAIYNFQNGLCPICRKKLRPPGSPNTKGNKNGLRVEVDHDHRVRDKRRSVRGLLCGGRFWGCNRRLGRVDNREWLLNASNYVENPPAQLVLKEIDDKK